MNKKMLKKVNADLMEQNTLLLKALQVTAGFVIPEARIVIKEGETRTHFCLYDSLQADGGIIIQTFFKGGQRPDTSVMYATDFFSERWFTRYTIEQVNELAKLRK